MKNFLAECKVTVVSTGATAGTTPVTTSALDMTQGTNFDSVVFVAILGAVTDPSTLQLTAYGNAANSNSGGTALTDNISGGNAATPAVMSSDGDASGTALIVDCYRAASQARYVYATLTRTTNNAVVDCILAIQYQARQLQPQQPASVLASFGALCG